uniref:Amino_oxidase domain-containing protein n=1 Tax=Parastrongyloides trichosuri TaxID=131310 RepID=A0A0N4ZTL0_PARTI
MSKPTKKFVICGAGPTAFGALHRLHTILSNDTLRNELPFIPSIVIIERENTVGGLARSIIDENGFIFDLGVHVISGSKYPLFMDVMQEAIEEWNIVLRNVKADFHHIIKRDKRTDSYISYPVQENILYFPDDIKNKCIKELKFLENNENISVNFEDFIENHFGKTLKEIFFKPYNEKVWTLKLNEMSNEWVSGRVPKVEINKLKNPLNENLDNKYENMTTFRYPSGCKGVGEIWKKISEKYPEEYFKLSSEVTEIDPLLKTINIMNTNTKKKLKIEYDYFISTMPITFLGKLTNLAPSINLKHSKVILVGFGLTVPQNKFSKSHSWLYFSNPEIIFYRATLISNFSIDLTPDYTKYWSVLCEIGLKADEEDDEKWITEKTFRDLKICGIVEDCNKIMSKFYMALQHGYPIPTLERNEELKRAHVFFEKHNIYSRGRFGAWKYESSNQDAAFTQGCEVIDKIIYGIDESLI